MMLVDINIFDNGRFRIRRYLSGLIAVIVLFSSPNLYAQVALYNADIQKAYEQYKQGSIKNAVELLIPNASEGDTAAQYNLAVIYYQYKDRQLYVKETGYWLERAAESGDAEAQFNLAMFDYDPENNDRLQTVVKWLRESARSGNLNAQYNLGYLSLNNLDVEITRNEGIEWLNKAAAADDSRAKRLVKLLLENRTDGAPNLYNLNLKFRTENADSQFVVNREGAEIFAFPAARQSPLIALSRGTLVKIENTVNNWFGVKVAGSFPVWVAEDELKIENKKASATGLEAFMYVRPGRDRRSYRVGVITPDESLNVVARRDGWVKVLAPEHYLAWIKKSDIAAVITQNQGDATQSGVSAETESLDTVAISEPDEEKQGEDDKIEETITLSEGRPVYESASSNAVLFGVVEEGTEVMVLERTNNFARVSWDGGVQAWVHEKYFKVSGDNGRVSGKAVRARILPSTGNDAKVVTELSNNEKFEVVASQSGWHRIIISPKNNGWIENL